MSTDANPASGSAATPKHIYTPTPAPPSSANEYARAAPATVTAAVQTIALDDFAAVHLQPCVRNSLLYGIGTGFAFGGLRLILGVPVPRAANWAAGTFAGASLVTYEFCQYRRFREKAGMQRAVEIIDRRKEERERQIEKREKMQGQARKELEERVAAEEAAAARRRWYRFW